MMHSDNRNRRHKMLRAPIAAALAGLMVSSCATQQSDRLALLGAPPYFALNAGAQPEAVARQSGYFAERDGCVVFQPADGSPMLTPVFPKGETQLVTDGIEWLGLYVKGSPVAMQKVYRLSGARDSANLSLASPIPGGCPSGNFVVGSVGSAVADGNAYRFCAGVTICRAFGMD